MKNQEAWVKLLHTHASPDGLYNDGDYLQLPAAEAEDRVKNKYAVYEDPPSDVFRAGEFKGRTLKFVLKNFGKWKLAEAVDWIRENSPNKEFLQTADEFLNDVENAGKCRCPNCGKYHRVNA